jgi:hypothetical protein
MYAIHGTSVDAEQRMNAVWAVRGEPAAAAASAAAPPPSISTGLYFDAISQSVLWEAGKPHNGFRRSSEEVKVHAAYGAVQLEHSGSGRPVD